MEKSSSQIRGYLKPLYKIKNKLKIQKYGTSYTVTFSPCLKKKTQIGKYKLCFFERDCARKLMQLQAVDQDS